MSATRPLNEDIVKPGLDAVFIEKFDEFQTKAFASVRDASIFRQVKLTGQATHTEDVMSDGGYWTERGEMEESDSVSVKTGYQVVYDPGEWAFQLPISRTLWENDMHGVVKDAIKRRARKGRATQERNGMLIFNRAFDTAFVGGDGKPLFSATHTLLGGDTFSNLITAALDEASLESAIQDFISMPDQDGIPYGEMPVVLLVPPDLFPTAVRITKSEQRSGVSDNDVNYISMMYPGLEVKQSVFLGAANGGSDSRWFLIGRDHGVTRVTRNDITTAFLDWKSQPNNAYLYKGFFEEAYGWSSPIGILGSNATT